MVQLLDQDIKTREVLDWKGIHLFHARISSCSQKVRVYLNYKGIPWTSHEVAMGDNNKPYYMGINPRGLVPALVHDGEVHIESNDIILYFEKLFPDPPLVPVADLDKIGELLRHEDDLHLPLRTVSFRFLMVPSKPPKSQEDLDAYAKTGSGTVRGQVDEAKLREIAFYRWFLEGGIPVEAVRAAVAQFNSQFRSLDETLSAHPYLLGDTISILDIAWMIYTHRLVNCGYPMERLHPHLWRWYEKLAADPRFAGEITMPPAVVAIQAELRAKARAAGDTLEVVCGL